MTNGVLIVITSARAQFARVQCQCINTLKVIQKSKKNIIVRRMIPNRFAIHHRAKIIT